MAQTDPRRDRSGVGNRVSDDQVHIHNDAIDLEAVPGEAQRITNNQRKVLKNRTGSEVYSDEALRLSDEQRRSLEDASVSEAESDAASGISDLRRELPFGYEHYHGEAPRVSDEQRRIIKKITGFGGYTAYLEDYKKKHSGYELQSWMYLRRIAKPQLSSDCDIFDLTKDENSLISFKLRSRTNSTYELFKALCEPQKGVYGRIMFWHTPRSSFNHTDFLEDLGLVLKIDPAFFRSVYKQPCEMFVPQCQIRAIVPNHIVVGDRVATMTHCCINENSRAVPIVFIADTADKPDQNRIISQELYSPPRPGPLAYGKMIMGIIERNTCYVEAADALMFPALLADLHIKAVNLRASCGYTPPNGANPGTGDSLEAINRVHNELRQRIEDFEDVTQDAVTGLTSLYGADRARDYQTETSIEYFKQTINRARRFEARIRDHSQLQIGKLSLEESKQSIELSVSQIGEAKRVKIFTVLAFVYVPLNLATSIFGMNIQQLNSSGQAIQTFLYTAVIILLLTGGLWLCIEEVNEYRIWSRRDRPTSCYPPPLSRPTYNMAVRVRMLVWLYCNGYWTWTCETKAWWYILANSRPDDRWLSEVIDPSDRLLSAGQYVSRYMCSMHEYRAFTIPSPRPRWSFPVRVNTSV